MDLCAATGGGAAAGGTAGAACIVGCGASCVVCSGAAGAAVAVGALAGARAGTPAGAGIAGLIALTALWQPDESVDMCCFRQFSAGAPPVGTDAQCAM